ncbi:PTS glucose transporter subunit IIA [Lactiplantibacillus mudanjiangensis]|uniref:PTS EIIA type-1 domain-containing protein n=1 Tax=Lactiplantibacillus mudanjiangensis TaxID=1296538 RepID=A0A660E5R8_9LACO|nr:PTS glucose transporter subunit IIA [Lactiplantibacillus mudanjiangensis]VDG24165.1 hypothetical protein [Lactobacillus sp. CBA3605] [Lactiplantibacillus mudanjiangensis]VDG30149.1 hypothetical protein [Lactobacillus sp. CBA3605] [Lactiplantibacillus mudanjiangensis]VDG30633.1 hypothetical protein [Lactobacillus sp. CBA3605] [Lactiplantibacillus mudanjiangensis]
MGLFRRHHQFKLKAPVMGMPVDLASVATNEQVRLAIKPTNAEVHSPIHGEVVALNTRAIKLQDLEGHTYWVRLTQALAHATTTLFDWQVRVGDSVSPMTLLGTFDITAVRQAQQAVLVTQTTLTAQAPQREVMTGMVMQS